MNNKNMHRRTFLNGMAGGAASLAFSRFGFAEQSPTLLNKTGQVEHVIYLYMQGGMSHVDTFDPKPGTEVQGEFKTIKSVTGHAISEHLPRLARVLDKTVVINSMFNKEGSHERGSYMMHTNYRQLGTIVHPSMGAWILKAKGESQTILPGHILIGRINNTAGFMGSKYEPLRINRPDQGIQNIAMDQRLKKDDFNHVMGLIDQLNKPFVEKYPQKNIQSYKDYFEKATGLMNSEDRKAFNLEAEDQELRAAYGQDSFGQGCLLARRLVERGVRFVEVVLRGWDTHQDNFEKVAENSEKLDRGLGTLLVDLEDRKLLDKTLIVLTTEFGRTPKINARNGRDHYPRCFSALLAGGGIKQGLTYGKSDTLASKIIENPVSVNDFNATIAQIMGIDPNMEIISNLGRPFKMTDGGKPIKAIIA